MQKTLKEQLIKNLIFTQNNEAKKILGIQSKLSSKIQKALKHMSVDEIIEKEAKDANINFIPLDAYSLAELKFYHLYPDLYEYVLKDKMLYVVTFQDELHTKICSILYKDFETNEEAHKFIGVVEFLGSSDFDDFEEGRKKLMS